MEKQFINPEGLVKPGVYTPAIRVSGGTTIYVSGQVSQDAAGKLVGKGDLLAQTEQVYKNLSIALLILLSTTLGCRLMMKQMQINFFEKNSGRYSFYILPLNQLYHFCFNFNPGNVTIYETATPRIKITRLIGSKIGHDFSKCLSNLNFLLKFFYTLQICLHVGCT